MVSTSRIEAEEKVCKEEWQWLKLIQSEKREIKSQDMRRVMMCSFDDGLSSVQITGQLRNVVSERITRFWKNSYKATGGIDLKAPPGSPRSARTKDLTHKVKQHLSSKNRQREQGIDLFKMTLIYVRIALQLYQSCLKTTRNAEFHLHIRFGKNYENEIKVKSCLPIKFVFSLEGIFTGQKERVDSVSREDANRRARINQRSKYAKRIMIWLGASKNGLTSLIIFQPGETWSDENYINVVGYYVWNAVTANMQGNKVNDYHSLSEEIKRGIRCVPLDGVVPEYGWSLSLRL